MKMWWLVFLHVFSVLGVLFSLFYIFGWMTRYIKSLIAQQIYESEWKFSNKFFEVKNLMNSKYQTLEEMIKKARGGTGNDKSGV